MKVQECELVYRYHFYFDKKESQVLRDAGWLHPMSSLETDIWWTEAEIEDLVVQFPELHDPLVKAMEKAKEMRTQAAKQYLSMMDNVL